jgi:prolyl-tRNA editing enzyme YbaK/EbsC (Cys-tRNA(Pro) deacylase)
MMNVSLELVKEYLKTFGFDERIKTFNVSSATVDLAAQALGIDGARIAKSLTFDVDGECVMVVCAGDAKIDNAKFKEFFHKKASMLSHDNVEQMCGHPIGGVCPFALKEGVKVYLDISLKRFDIVYPAAGTPSSAVELHVDELFKASKAIAWIDVCKAWQ